MFITYYHNVVEGPLDDLDRRSSRLTAQAFRKQMTFLSEHFHPMSLKEMLDRARYGEPDPQGVAVTFDDAYEGVGTHAAPILRELGMPATVFVITETLEKPERPLHFEEFELALRLTTKESVALPELNLKAKLTSMRGKAMFLKKVKPFLKEIPDARRRRLHKMILEELGVESSELQLCPSGRKLTPSQLKALSETGLWETGGHTRTHRVLSQLPTDEARREIEGCFEDLLCCMETAPRYFAYPYGKPQHIGDADEIARASGFQAALTTSQGGLSSQGDPFRIPRVDFLDLMASQSPELQQEAREYFYS